MSIFTLKDRMLSYKEAHSYKLTRKLPVVINVNGRGFSRVTKNLEKPFSPDFLTAMSATTAKLCHEIEGAVLGYCYGDDITIISQNDQTIDTMPWFQNNLQKICSTASSIATLEFNNASRSIGIQYGVEAIFTTEVYTLPNVSEAVNLLIYKQQSAVQKALGLAAYYELEKKYGGQQALDMLSGTTTEDKELLLQQCGINFQNYESVYKKGLACYRAPTLVGERFKNKWILSHDLVQFSKEQSFLNNIFNTGCDIYRE